MYIYDLLNSSERLVAEVEQTLTNISFHHQLEEIEQLSCSYSALITEIEIL